MDLGAAGVARRGICADGGSHLQPRDRRDAEARTPGGTVHHPRAAVEGDRDRLHAADAHPRRSARPVHPRIAGGARVRRVRVRGIRISHRPQPLHCSRLRVLR